MFTFVDMDDFPEIKRCLWCERDDLYRRYHDEEWGVPSHDDRYLFELLVMEFFQAGLSWYTILSKREAFNLAFDAFDVYKVSAFDDKNIAALLNNSGIIRHRLKIQAAIENAKRFIEVQNEFGSFSNYIWSFTSGETIANKPSGFSVLPSKTDLSDSLSKDLKKRGFKFMGSTVCYAYLQAIGVIDDHFDYCFKSK
jgi:DNA-3-methyladenine glycosylase I